MSTGYLIIQEIVKNCGTEIYNTPKFNLLVNFCYFYY